MSVKSVKSVDKNLADKVVNYLTLLAMTLLLTACSGGKLAEGEHYLGKVVINTGGADIDKEQITPYLTPQRIQTTYSIINGKKSKAVFDPTKAQTSCDNIISILNNIGYMQAEVRMDTALNSKGKMDVTYHVTPGKQLFVDSFNIVIEDQHIDSLLRHSGALPSPTLFVGKSFNADALNAERKRITDFLLDNGYTHFNKDFITVDADTMEGSDKVWLEMTLTKYRATANMEPTDHPQYTVGKITYDCPFLRKSILKDNTLLEEGKLFRYSDLQNTYNRLARLRTIKTSQIELSENEETRTTDALIRLRQRKVNSISFMPEGTNTQGNLGAAATLTYSNSNIFRGSEMFSIEMRSAFEFIKGLEGYSDNLYFEFGVEGKIQFPRLLAPFVTRNFRRRQVATSELSVSYNLQNRPEFQRRAFRGTWRYRWASESKSHNYTFDLIDLNYISMPKISDTFRQNYLEGTSKKNAILKYNYENIFIMKTGASMAYKDDHKAFKIAFETAGNLLGGIAPLVKAEKNDLGQRKIFNVAFAQYVKGDFEYTRIINLTGKHVVTLHGALGIAYPYGNSTMLPFEKRYFAGGANSLRGWNVRGLGPGKFRSTDGAIDFINQTGDMKLDLNVEFRGPIIWKLQYAAFIDAGNIWTIRSYDDQPGGQFTIKSLAEELAVSYGIGLRLNFDFFILRIDCGMKAVNPAYTDKKERFPIIYPRLKRDFAFHFAVGLPF